ncbi:MAG: glycosyltransferase family 1 protein [Microcystis novacekii Mn_MB_F_20050700_S1]|jgi:glycosyltransferase involved in cell wall biosynthesis|uniref:Glycosyltransferase family 1 protein n=1 Tax=Microcystis novacekii Mn_MB_F_20050700_S1D TaxID=2486266 RepID=A0A552JBS3_9CHRO|nr:MAG: glycosyltransferase family 1 protein [Microcystis novacekii Mn_MB_F_20050700_S1]TRU93210.1 MAG: glycosyltransferase family 1 protein [Microcystis novacekii Mn_MB_F_20050700_S1D]
MSLRIAYEISILGSFYGLLDPKTGIYRVTEKVLFEILKSEEIQVTLNSLCSETPAMASINCSLYTSNFLEDKSCQFINTFQSKYKLEWLYKSLFLRYFSSEFQKLPKYSFDSILIRGMLKVMEKTRLNLLDNHKFFNPQEYDLLHSPHYALPPEELTGNLPRLLTIYDLIPIKATEFVPPSLTNYFQKIINSVNIQKDWVTCISEYTRQEFCEYTGMSLERAFVTPLAADEQFYPVDNPEEIQLTRQRYNLPEGDYFLCLASHLEPRKNIPFLIRSFIQLINEQPNLDINLVLIGSLRHKRPELITLMEELKAYQNRVIFTGYVPDEDLSALYSGAKAFIFPSLQEGFGLPILEAMQCGTPVISSNATSLPEVAGEAAILINPYDKDELSQAMLNLLSDEKLRNELTQKGIERAKQFSWSKCAQETVEIYKKIAK